MPRQNQPLRPSRPSIQHSRTERQSYADAAAEAENRPLEFDPNIRSQYIRNMIQTILTMQSQGLTEEEIEKETHDFAINYPNFFKKLIAKEDLQPIYGMLSMLDKMGQGQVSQHEASIAVGTHLYKKYVEPNLRR